VEHRSLKFIAEAVRGELKNGSPQTLVSRVCTDSRQAQPGDLFIALAGERFDAHDFLKDVAGKKVTAVMAERAKIPTGFGSTAILVESTRKALVDLGSVYRADFEIPVIAVGGSNGKTSTKELVAAVLRQKFPTLWSEASFNNDIGVPLTLLKLENVHKAAVLEVGTNHPGELAALLRIVRPRYSVLTSIGREHLEFFGDIDGVIKEEGSLAEMLPNNGKFFVNAESDWTKPISKRARVAVAKVGWSTECDFSARNVRMDDAGVRFTATTPRSELNGEYRIKLLGKHQVLNALLAIAVGAELGLSREEIQQGLAECEPAKMRMQLWAVDGIRVLDDAYNANADSMLAALETLAALPCTGRRVAVLGDMAELGEHSNSSHVEIGRKAAELGVNHLFAVGKMAHETANGARNAGCKNVSEIAAIDEAAGVVKDFLREGDLVLLKASRSTRLERIGEFLKRAVQS
jgi:UDP-N-acetylmuramoyl-tripeptide--D-alanyl-D-alanine ligase